MSTTYNSETSSSTAKQSQSFIQQHGRKLIAAVLWLIIAGGLYVYAYTNDLSALGLVQRLADLLQTPYGPLIYLLAYLIRPLLFFSSVLLTVTGGAVFGPVWGFIYTIIAGNASGFVAYLVGRFFGESVLEKSDSHTLLSKYTQRMRDNSFETILLMRLIFLPYDLVNYLAGFLRINWVSFVLATFIGAIPGTLTFVLFGSSLDLSQGIREPSFNPWTLAASGVLLLLSLGISRYLRSRHSKAPETE